MIRGPPPSGRRPVPARSAGAGPPQSPHHRPGQVAGRSWHCPGPPISSRESVPAGDGEIGPFVAAGVPGVLIVTVRRVIVAARHVVVALAAVALAAGALAAGALRRAVPVTVLVEPAVRCVPLTAALPPGPRRPAVPRIPALVLIPVPTLLPMLPLTQAARTRAGVAALIGARPFAGLAACPFPRPPRFSPVALAGPGQIRRSGELPFRDRRGVPMTGGAVLGAGRGVPLPGCGAGCGDWVLVASPWMVIPGVEVVLGVAGVGLAGHGRETASRPAGGRAARPGGGSPLAAAVSRLVVAGARTGTDGAAGCARAVRRARLQRGGRRV